MTDSDKKEARETLKRRFAELGLDDEDVSSLLDDDAKFSVIIEKHPSFVEYLNVDEGLDGEDDEGTHLDSTGMNLVKVDKKSIANILDALK